MPSPPHTATFRFYGSLNDFLPPVHRQGDRVSLYPQMAHIEPTAGPLCPDPPSAPRP